MSQCFFNIETKGNKYFKKNVWKPNSVAVLSKLNKWTSKTKICAPPQGIYLLTQNNLENSTGRSQRKVFRNNRKSRSYRPFSALGCHIAQCELPSGSIRSEKWELFGLQAFTDKKLSEIISDLSIWFSVF